MVGFSEHTGHALTYKVLTSDTSKILYRSEVRSASSDTNLRVSAPNGETGRQVTCRC
jgi:hypothetical protein